MSIVDRIRIYAENTGWLLGEKAFRLAIGFVATLVVARYLGPADFGLLSYALSLAALFGIAGHMGLAGLVVRELVEEPEHCDEIMGTAIALKAIGACAGFVLLAAFAFLTTGRFDLEFWLIAIAGASLLIKPAHIFEYWFQSQLASRFTAIAQSAGHFVMAGFKVALALLGAPLLAFAFAGPLQVAVAAAAMLGFYRRGRALRPARWRFSSSRGRSLLQRGWPVFLGTLFGLVYLKVDQIMLRWLVGPGEVGIYSVAVTFSEAWYFVPVAIVTPLFPRLVALRRENEERYRRRLQQIFDLLFLCAAAVALLVTLVADPVIRLALGERFAGAAPILAVHVWAAVFIFMRALFSKWILMEGALRFSMITQGAGAVLNVALNAALIPAYGGMGAAVATLISYATASWLSLALHAQTRPVFRMMGLAFFAPVRLLRSRG